MTPFETKRARLDWAAFPRPMQGLSAREKERLGLAALWEADEALYWPADVSGDQARRASALCREIQEDALYLSALLPSCPPIERAVRLEQLQADLTAALCLVPGTQPVRAALEFFLIEDTDRLYRFANLLDEEQERPAESVLDGQCEITPGRPCAAAHRDPIDSVFNGLDLENGSRSAALSVVLLSGLKGQVARVYTACAATAAPRARAMFAEAALLLQEQFIAYSSLWDERLSGAERLLWRRRAAHYLFESLYAGEKHDFLRVLWQDMAARKASQLHGALLLANRVEDELLPPRFVLADHSARARAVLAAQATLTRLREALIPVEQMPADQAYFAYQRTRLGDGRALPSHDVIRRYIERYGTDYRFEKRPSALEAHHNRHIDNLALARGRAALVRPQWER